MASMKELRSLVGESRLLTGYLDEVVIQRPTDKDIERAQKGKYEAKTKYYFVFSPNQLEARKIKFDPEKFKPEQLQTLEAAFISVECEVRPYEFKDEGTGQTKKGETAELVKVRTIYRDSEGQEPKRS